jgi:Polysaccharide deacetylase/FG-GAP-like repeat
MTQNKGFLRLVVLMLVCIMATPQVFGQVRAKQFYGATEGTHPGVIYLTVDDLPEEPSQKDGTYQTILVKNVLRDAGLPAAFMAVACHIAGQGYPISGTSQCVSLGDVPVSVLQEIANDGFLVGNHTFSHIPFSNIQSPATVVSEVAKAQLVVDSLGQALGLKVVRCPGLDCGNNVTVLNGQSGLSGLRGPINADVGGGFYTDSIQPVPGFSAGSSVGGDWWFYLNKFDPELAGYYFVRDIIARGAQSGVIVLLHTRSDVMTGRDGSRGFPVKLIGYILANVPAGFSYAPLDGIPGLLGNVRTSAPELISTEFGTNDGQGRVEFASLTGSESEQDFCKARDSSVRCMLWKEDLGRRPVLPNSTQKENLPKQQHELARSTSWYDISDQNWATKYASKFWLADINNDGKADLIFPSQKGFMVGYSNGASGFSAPELLLAGSFDFRGVRFADLNNDGFPDLVLWTPSAVLSYINNGHGGFNLPIVASLEFPSQAGWDNNLYLSTLRLADMNYDGCQDLLMRGPTDVFVAPGDCRGSFGPAQSWSKRFSDRQNFNLPGQNQTFSVAKINGYTGLGAGLFTGGVVFQQSSPGGKSGQYRYIMDNGSYSGDPAFHPEAYASDLLFVNLFNDGNTSPVLVTPNGLYASHIRNVVGN